jgi:bifunctional non-homologous end joining protein LigD
MPPRPPTAVVIDGHRLALTNLDKVLYPATGFTKAEVIDYYTRVAPALLPHLAGRSPTLVRAPNGVDGERFFEKRCPPHHPDWIATGDAAGYHGCLIETRAALAWTANLAAIELHVQQARCDMVERPTAMVFDLDPGPGCTLLDCKRVAEQLRDFLDRLGVATVMLKTSGSKGLHLSVPLNDPERRVTDDDTKRFALALGQLLEQRDGKRVTTNMAKEQRERRVFVDWSQNDAHKTTVAPYSMRIRERPWVSTPITWEEIDALDDPDGLRFEAPDVLARVEQHGDLFAANLTVQQVLPHI